MNAGSARNLALVAQDSKVDVESQPAQRHNYLNGFEQLQFALQIRAGKCESLRPLACCPVARSGPPR